MGVRVLDRETQQAVEVTGEQAAKGVASGRFTMPEGSRIDVQRPDGGLATIDPSDITQAIAGGYQVLSPEEAHSAQIKQEENTAAGLATGAATELLGGATLGLSTKIGVETGLIDPERAKARQEALGGVGTALGLAGAVAPTLLTGGAGGVAAAGARGAGALARRAGGAALRGVTAPTRALAGAGRAAETALARSLPGTGVALRGLMPMAGREGVMGAGYGVGQEIHESAIGDRDLTAERLLASGAMGAFLGAAGATGLAGLGKIASGAGRLSKRSTTAIMERAGVGGSSSVAESLADGLAKGQAWFTGGPEALYRRNIRGVLTKKGRRDTLLATRHMGEVTEKAAREIKRDLDEVIDAGLESHMFVGGAAKPRQQAARIPAAVEHNSVQNTARHLKEAATQLREMTDTPGYGSQATVRELLKNAEAKIARLEAAPNKTTAYEVADGFKRDIDGLRGKFRELTGDDAATKDAILGVDSGIRKSFKEMLEDSSTWGDDVARAQSTVNAEITTLMKMRENIPRAFKKETPLTTREALQIARKSSKFAGETETEATRAYINQQRKVMDAVEANYDLDKVQKSAFHKGRQAVGKFEATLERHSEMAAKADDFATARGYEGEGSPSLSAITSPGTVLGFMAGGPIGAAAGAAMTRPYTTARTLAGVLEMADKINLRTVKAVAAGMSRKAVKAAKGVGPRALTAGVARRDRHEKAAEKVTAYAANPDLLQKRLEPHTGILGKFAPRLNDALALKAQAGAAFLQSKLPPVTTPMWGGKPLVDDGALSKFARYLDAVEDPLGAVELLESGQFTFEHAEAIKAVYPSMFAAMQEQAIDEVARMQASGEVLPYARRSSMSALLEMPLDPSLVPASVAASQVVHAQNPEQQPPPPPSRGGSSKPYGERFGTSLSRIEAGQGEY